MSFRVIKDARRFAIDGEVNAAVAAERSRLAKSITTDGGAGLSNAALATLKTAVDELLSRAPHDCDVSVDLWGAFEADGTGGVRLTLTIAQHEAPAAEESAAAATAADPSLAGSIEPAPETA